jgi:hypothetical protein
MRRHRHHMRTRLGRLALWLFFALLLSVIVLGSVWLI